MRITWLIIYCFFCYNSFAQSFSGYRLPAEWEKQEAVILTYSGDPDDLVTTEKVHRSTRSFIKAVSPHLKIYLLISVSHNKDSLLQLFRNEQSNLSNLELVAVPYLFSMGVARDYGPMITRDANGVRKLVQFEWDYVGADFIHPDTAWTRRKNLRRDRYFNQLSQLLGIGITKNPLAIEGGEIELNGKGVAIIADSFTRRRNPFISDKIFDSLLHASLGVTKLIRLREGIAEDPAPGQSRLYGDLYGSGVGGHVDEFVRFVNPTTLFLAMPDSAEVTNDPVKKISYERMRVNEQLLMTARDQDEKPFTIIHIPVPDVVPDEFVMDTSSRMHPVASLHREYPDLNNGDRIRFLPAVSYLNYVVLNDLVIIPAYWRPGFPATCKQEDEKVRALYARYFPGKKIIQLDPWGMNYGGGGFHCWTQQVPEGR